MLAQRLLDLRVRLPGDRHAAEVALDVRQEHGHPLGRQLLGSAAGGSWSCRFRACDEAVPVHHAERGIRTWASG